MDINPTPHTEPIRQMIERLGASTVFGVPMNQDGIVVIPVAQVQMGFGYGGGYGRGPEGSKAEPGVTGEAGAGGGTGGGAGGRTIPRGFIQIAGGEVKFQPITDETRIPIAGILMVAWIVFWVMVTIRSIAKAVAKTQQLKAKVGKPSDKK